MSIRDEISARISEGRLFPVEPRMPDDPVARLLVVSEEINALLMGPWSGVVMERRCNELQADLEVFVKGQELGMCLTPHEAGNAYMGLLDPPSDGVWDIRSRGPSPGLRIIGHFAATDVFVGLIYAPRSVRVPWTPRLPLGSHNSPEWVRIINQCKAGWRQLFHSYLPYQGVSIHDYISKRVFLV